MRTVTDIPIDWRYLRFAGKRYRYRRRDGEWEVMWERANGKWRHERNAPMRADVLTLAAAESERRVR